MQYRYKYVKLCENRGSNNVDILFTLCFCIKFFKRMYSKLLMNYKTDAQLSLANNILLYNWKRYVLWVNGDLWVLVLN